MSAGRRAIARNGENRRDERYEEDDERQRREGHHGKHGTADEAVAVRQEEGLRREAERVLRSNLGIPHSHPLDRNKVRMDDKARAAWSAYDRAIEGME